MSNLKSTFSIIDILTLVDAETLVSRGLSTNPQAPTVLPNNGADTIYMVTTGTNAIGGNGGNELNVSGVPNDVVRWRSSSLTSVSDYQAFLYGINFSSGGSLLSTPAFLNSQVSSSWPAPGWPANGVNTGTSNDYFWQSTLLATGTATYQFIVAVYNRSGTLQGYFTWDPFITISNG